ncbi:MAG: thioredoxin family protein, partial [Chloroflexota bacterium]
TKEAVKDLGVQAEVEKVTEYREIVSYGVMATPGLVIDGEVRSAGRIPSKAEISSWITAAQAS